MDELLAAIVATPEDDAPQLADDLRKAIQEGRVFDTERLRGGKRSTGEECDGRRRIGVFLLGIVQEPGE